MQSLILPFFIKNMHVVKVYYQEHKAKLWNYSVASLDLWGHIAINFLHKFPHLTQKKKVWLQRTIAKNYKLHSNRIKCVHHLCLYLLICLYFTCITYGLYNLVVSHLSTLRLIDWTKSHIIGKIVFKPGVCRPQAGILHMVS